MKPWAASATAKSMQKQFICLRVNLMQLLELELGRQGICNTPEETRRTACLELASKVAATANAVLPKTLRLMRRIAQHSVKLIRWVAAQLWANIPGQQACAVLIAFYPKL